MKLQSLVQLVLGASMILASFIAKADLQADFERSKKIARGDVSGLSVLTYVLGHVDVKVYVDDNTGTAFLVSPALQGLVPFDPNYGQRGGYIFSGAAIKKIYSGNWSDTQAYASTHVFFILDNEKADQIERKKWKALGLPPEKLQQSYVQNTVRSLLKTGLSSSGLVSAPVYNNCPDSDPARAQSFLAFRNMDMDSEPSRFASEDEIARLHAWHVFCQQKDSVSHSSEATP